MSDPKLKIGFADDGRMLAIAYEESGDDVIVLDVEVVNNDIEARRWFDKVSKGKPWIERS